MEDGTTRKDKISFNGSGLVAEAEIEQVAQKMETVTMVWGLEDIQNIWGAFGNVKTAITPAVVEGTDFSVDKAAGKITFFTPPGKTPVEGKDNVIITAKKCVSESKAKINGCRRSIAFGDGGSANRIFVCGNREMPGTDFWCAVNDPTYWPDSYYGEPGGGDAEIMGYSVIDGKLGTHMKPAQFSVR